MDPGEILDELRLLKDEHETGRLRDAARLNWLALGLFDSWCRYVFGLSHFQMGSEKYLV